jgi:hypothetical protein
MAPDDDEETPPEPEYQLNDAPLHDPRVDEIAPASPSSSARGRQSRSTTPI